MAKKQDFLPYNTVHKIRKSVASWEASDIKVLVQALCDSHERLRHALDQQEHYKDIFLRSMKARKKGRR